MTSKTNSAVLLSVKVWLDAETIYAAEKTLDDLLRPYEDDDRLIAYEVTASDWTPRYPEHID